MTHPIRQRVLTKDMCFVSPGLQPRVWLGWVLVEALCPPNLRIWDRNPRELELPSSLRVEFQVHPDTLLVSLGYMFQVLLVQVWRRSKRSMAKTARNSCTSPVTQSRGGTAWLDEAVGSGRIVNYESFVICN